MNRKPGAPNFTAKAKDKELQMEIYDTIGADYFSDNPITAQSVADALKVPYDSITLRLNSPGGSAFDGVAIYNILRGQGKPVNVIVDGVAASAASVVAMAGDTITMGDGSLLMIHGAMAMAGGFAADLRSMADTLDRVTENMANIYVARTKQPKDQVVAWMNAETWMDPTECIDRGFATAKGGAAPTALAKFDLSAFKNAPKTVENTEKPAEIQPVVEEEDPMIDILRKRLSMQRQG